MKAHDWVNRKEALRHYLQPFVCRRLTWNGLNIDKRLAKEFKKKGPLLKSFFGSVSGSLGVLMYYLFQKLNLFLKLVLEVVVFVLAYFQIPVRCTIKTNASISYRLFLQITMLRLNYGNNQRLLCAVYLNIFCVQFAFWYVNYRYSTQVFFIM